MLRWWFLDSFIPILHFNAKSRKIEPTRTCIPWNPVVTKNLLPKALSLVVNLASLYSNNWQEVNINPNKIVNTIEVKTLLLLISLWCAKVTLTPLLSKIIVFKSGSWNGFILFKL